MQDVDLKDVYVYNKKRLLCIKQSNVFTKKNVRFLYLTPIYLFDICFILLQK